MDSWTVSKQQGAAVEAKRKEGEALLLIKTRMPETYAAIQAKAAQQGNGVYTLVRRGIRGQANCFWATEAGHVVGTPFNQGVQAEAAQAMVRFGCAYVCILADAPAVAEVA